MVINTRINERIFRRRSSKYYEQNNKNAGPHLESSGSAPIKKVRAGEVAIAFGLRHQAIKDKNDGLPIKDYIDPIK